MTQELHFLDKLSDTHLKVVHTFGQKRIFFSQLLKLLQLGIDLMLQQLKLDTGGETGSQLRPRIPGCTSNALRNLTFLKI